MRIGATHVRKDVAEWGVSGFMFLLGVSGLVPRTRVTNVPDAGTDCNGRPRPTGWSSSIA